MVDYSNGKIYKIWSAQTERIYVGSTTQSLSKRMAAHRYDMKINRNTSSKIILAYPDARIELIESFPCNNSDELNAREGYWIRSENCVNKCIAGNLTEKGRVEYDKQYRFYG